MKSCSLNPEAFYPQDSRSSVENSFRLMGFWGLGIWGLGLGFRVEDFGDLGFRARVYRVEDFRDLGFRARV